MAKITIIINGRDHEIKRKKISYSNLMSLVYGDENIVASVAYRSGNTGGVLNRGQSISVKNGMIFNVYVTGEG